jgi:hypothetical protein
MPDGPRQDRLKAELNAARKAYERAKVEFDHASSLASELGLNCSDGAHSLRSATHAYNHALEKYSAAVKRYAELILNESVLKTTGCESSRRE